LNLTLPAPEASLEDAVAPVAAMRRSRPDPGPVRAALRALEAAFNQPFLLVDVDSGDLNYAAPHGLICDFYSRLSVIQEIVSRGVPELVEEESPLAMIAVPLRLAEQGPPLAAIGLLMSSGVGGEAEIASAARVFGIDSRRAFEWSQRNEAWNPRVALRLAESTIENIRHRTKLAHLEHEITEAVGHARDSCVELGLLHRLARGLDVSQGPDDLWRSAVAWLAEAVPAQCIVAVARRDAAGVQSALLGDHGPAELYFGEYPVEPRALCDMMERLGSAARRSLVMNRAHTSAPTWDFPTIRELASVPVLQGTRLEGWLLAINHAGVDGDDFCEFGSAEIRLLESVSTLLGVHRHNTHLFARQGDLFAASVRALTSAIDAKDPYTHGHSERVARVAVCIALEMGLDKELLDTIYLGGLLHDIGKIGIDDNILKKAGPLSPEEHDHIKKHPQLGYDILSGVTQLQKILPIVLHHHEAWDGTGYPHGLQGNATPLIARIAAVADAFDAMASDRPYRRGMADEQLDEVVRAGAGRQWDPQVVDAFFACREQIRRAAHDQLIGTVPIDPLRWID
jgi:putative nucleotidyltransferase with HDIG domain